MSSPLGEAMSEEDEPHSLTAVMTEGREDSRIIGPPHRLDEDDLARSRRTRKAESSVAKARAAVAARNAQIAADESRRARAQARLEQEEENAKLARAGYRRSFWTGRLVPVRRSIRAKAHVRHI